MFTHNDLLNYLDEMAKIEIKMIKTAEEFKAYFKDDESTKLLEEIRIDEVDHKEIIDSIKKLITSS